MMVNDGAMVINEIVGECNAMRCRAADWRRMTSPVDREIMVAAKWQQLMVVVMIEIDNC